MILVRKPNLAAPALLLALMLSLIPLMSGCKPSSLVSRSQEVEIGQQASQEVESQYRVVNDPRLNAMVNQIGQTLVKCSDRQDVKYTFKVLDVSDVNAFSLPGGWVYVNKGLIDATHGNTDELAGVIAHEIGHVVARHHAEMIGRETYAEILVGTLTSGQTQQVAGVFANLELLHWSRQQEYQADRLGIDEMYRCRANYNPEGLISFFGVLAKGEKSQPSKFSQMFRTHPLTPERVKRAQAYLDDLRAGRAKP